MPRLSPPVPLSLGERLRRFRAEVVPTGWSRPRLAQTTGLSVAVITRLERTGRGSAPALVTLLDFYRTMGLNVAWAIALDQAYLLPHSFDARWGDLERLELAKELAELRHLTQETALQERLTRALVQLLPDSYHPLRGPLDLRHYHDWLPPVAAVLPGWRCRAFDILPYHYYPAGESLPPCGDPYAYLTHAGLPQRPSRSARCATCSELLPDS